jgi:hypothetical protein
VKAPGRGAYLSFLSQSAFFFWEMRRQVGLFPILPHEYLDQGHSAS